MAVDPALTELMTDTIVIKNATAYSGSGYGVPTTAAGVSHRAFVQKRQRIARDADGSTVRSDYDVYTDSILSNLSADDVIEYDGKRFRAVSVDVFRDETGPHHTVIGMAQVVSPT